MPIASEAKKKSPHPIVHATFYFLQCQAYINPNSFGAGKNHTSEICNASAFYPTFARIKQKIRYVCSNYYYTIIENVLIKLNWYGMKVELFSV